MKHVVTIGELHKLIPNTKTLENKNFKNLQNLISSVIEAVEASGEWEFVQYIQGNPSLFIVSEREVRQMYVEKQYGDPIEEISNHYNPPRPTKKSQKESVKERKTEEQREQPKENPLYDSEKLFPKTDLPW